MAIGQTTYYWVGGATGAFTTNASWNTALDGTGTVRSASAATDVLIFDGSNIGGTTTPITGTVTPVITSGTTFGQLKLQNGINLVFQRSVTGGSTFIINGDGTSTDDFTIDATSSLKITTPTAAFNFTLSLGVASTNLSTGLIAGTIRLDDAGLASTVRLDALNAGALIFANGSNLYYNNRSSISNYGFSASPVGAMVFNSGSNLIYQPSIAGKMFSTTTYPAPSMPFVFNRGSNIILEGPIASFVDLKILSNVIVRNNQTITLDGNPSTIDTLTINSGSTLYIKSTGNTNITGGIINNGSFGSAGAGATSSALLLFGTTPQSIGGSGTFLALGSLQIGADADVTLNTNIVLNGSATSSIVGKLNAQNYSIGGSSSISPYNIRTAASVTTSGCTSSANGYTVTLPTAVYATGVNTANAVAGVLVSGTDFLPNTYVVGTSSGTSTITLSKPCNVKSSTTTVTLSNQAGTLVTSNAGGLDGTITTGGTRVFGSGTNYVLNAATTSPFSVTSTNAIGNLTINAPITTNKAAQSISGTLTLGTGNLTIRNTDTIKLLSTATDIAGSPSSSKYIISEVSGANAGVLLMNGITTAKTFPIGTASKYMPVTLTPTSAMDFAVSVFPGSTKNGTPDGIAFSTKQKEDLVDAVWTINRVTGTGDCAVQLSWDPSFEGSNFTTLASTAIGISRFDATAADWTPFSSTSADNSANTITQTFSSFSPFVVGAIGLALPVTLTSFEATTKNNAVALSWTTDNEVAISQYIVEKSANGVDFAPIGSVNAANAGNYSFSDLNPNNGAGFYRLKMMEVSGTYKFSQVLLVKSTGNLSIGLYPNPVANTLTVTGLKNKSSIRILNMNGQTMLLKNTNSNIISLNVAGYKAGIYKIQISNETGLLKTVSFIKQ
jgi:hypothetical protein